MKRIIRGKIEYLVLEYGTIFSIDQLIWSVNGEVEGLRDGYLLMEVSEEYAITEKLVDIVIRLITLFLS